MINNQTAISKLMNRLNKNNKTNINQYNNNNNKLIIKYNNICLEDIKYYINKVLLVKRHYLIY